MVKKKKKSSGGGANWMDTYGDLVTLLFAFFVMLYAMSSVDESKWVELVKSFNPDAITDEGNPLPGATEGPAIGPDYTESDGGNVFDVIMQSIQEMIENEGLTEKVSVTKGNGYVFVTFDDSVFFTGDSYTLLDSGKHVLDLLSESLVAGADEINEIRVLGHTAQADPSRPNYSYGDRFLASNRATIVTVYLQDKEIVDPSRLVSVGYGQWRPVGDNSNPEGQSANRRVEIIISGFDSEETYDEIENYYIMRDGAESTEDVNLEE